MKTRGWLVAAILCSIAPVYAIAQCGTIHTVTYDTTVYGNGNTNTPYRFSFPKLPASAGTFVSAHISSTVTLTYGFTVENADPSPRPNLRVRITRSDEIVSPYVTPDPYDYLSPNFTFSLAANDGVPGSGADFNTQPPVNLRNNDTAFSMVSNSVDFVGTDSVWFDYSTSMGYAVSNGTANVNPQATDAITFQVTYTYCDEIILSPGGGRVRPDRSVEVIKNRISPNPSNTGNFKIRFDNKARGDWQVEIYSTSGQLVNRKLFYNALDAVVHNDKNLQPGVYVVKATNLKSYATFVERLMVK